MCDFRGFLIAPFRVVRSDTPPSEDERTGPDMAGTCELCGKTTTFGHNVSFSKRRTNRKFKANVHRKTLTVNGVTIRTNVCTQCMRTAAKTK